MPYYPVFKVIVLCVFKEKEKEEKKKSFTCCIQKQCNLCHKILKPLTVWVMATV